MNNRQVSSNFFYRKTDSLFMNSQNENEFVEQLSRWAESIGINLDRDPEQV